MSPVIRFRVWALGFMVYGIIRTGGVGFRVYRAYGLAFRV